MSRCIFCGLCEEACPTGAIVLRHEYELADYDIPHMIYTKEMMLVPEPRSGEGQACDRDGARKREQYGDRVVFLVTAVIAIVSGAAM